MFRGGRGVGRGGGGRGMGRGGGGKGMVRGGRGGGGMSKSSIRRALSSLRLHRGTHILPPSSSDSPNFILKHKSSSPATCFSSSSGKNSTPFWHHIADIHDSDWVSVDTAEGVDEGLRSFYGLNPPSKNEVEEAVHTIQHVFGNTLPFQQLKDIQDNEQGHYLEPCSDRDDSEQGHNSKPGSLALVSAEGSEIDWTEPSFLPYNLNRRQVNGYDRFYYAIHLLQNDPSVQRMVRSLSTDEAVWDAVQNNEVVQELRDLISADEENLPQNFDVNGTSDSDSRNAANSNVVIWILSTVKSKFIETIEQITKIVTNLFQSAFSKTTVDAGEIYLFNEKLRTSFMLSIMVMLIVMVTRLHYQGTR